MAVLLGCIYFTCALLDEAAEGNRLLPSQDNFSDDGGVAVWANPTVAVTIIISATPIRSFCLLFFFLSAADDVDDGKYDR